MQDARVGCVTRHDFVSHHAIRAVQFEQQAVLKIGVMWVNILQETEYGLLRWRARLFLRLQLTTRYVTVWFPYDEVHERARK